MEHRGRGRGRGRGYRRGRNNYRDQQRQPAKVQPTRVIERTELPIFQHKDSILAHIAKYPIGIVEAATGSGKSTQMPQFLLERYPECTIIAAQTSKLGASEVASRVAEEMECRIGEVVGTIFKGDIKVSENTRIFFTTTDILLEHSLNDDFRWDFVIIDEVHDRSLETDLLLAVIKMRLSEGKNFKLLIMSATIQNILPSYFLSSDMKRTIEQRFEKKQRERPDMIDWGEGLYEQEEGKANPRNRINNRDAVEIFHNDARLFEIEEIYLERTLEILSVLYERMYPGTRLPELSDFSQIFVKDADTNPSEIPEILYRIACQIILCQHLKFFKAEEKPYTFLVFLPGIIEINLMNDMLIKTFADHAEELEIIMLHTNIPDEEYDLIFCEPEVGKRRVILSSNVAESSITLTDVRFIIDFGMNRETAYNNQRNSSSFDLVWAAKSNMKQRAGRVGRVANGTVFRLMTTQFFKSMLYDFVKPEIQRSSLDKIILKLKLKNIENLRDLLGNILEAPDDMEILKTEKFLIEVGALNYAKKITSLGEIYTEFPFEIRVTRLCMFGIIFGCLKQSMKIGALLSLEKGPVKNLSGLPGNMSRNHPKTFKARLIFDMNMNSDLFMMMHAYDKWYERFGRGIKHQVFQNGHRVSLKHRIPEEEMEHCNYFYLDPFILREALCQYCEIRHKFLSAGLDKRHLKVAAEDEGFTVKLCLAAAFPGKYLISNYKLRDEVSREKMMDKIGRNASTTLMIPEVPPCVVPSDIEQLISLGRDKPRKVSIVYSNALIEYESDVNPNTIKLVLWLGRYGRRYFNLAWVLMKRVTRDNANRVIMKSLVNISINELNKVPINQRREGVIADLNCETIQNGTVTDEIVFLCKPEFPFLLEFRDIASRSEVLVEDDSVNSHCYTTDLALSQKFMIVCADYTQRKSLTIGKNSTLMPFIPLLPHILSLIFCSKVEYMPNSAKDRYHSIRFLNYETTLPFDFVFTREDAVAINDIRRNIGQCLGSTHYTTDVNNHCSIKEEIISLLMKPRVPIIDELPDWRPIIKWRAAVRPNQPQSEGLGCIKLLEIEENEGLYYGADTLSEIRAAKQEYTARLERSSNNVSCSKAELVCRECGAVICGVDGIENIEVDPPVVSIKPYYGVLQTLEYDESQCNRYMEYVIENYQVNNWEVCANNHVVAWSEREDTFICESSPVVFRLPMMKIIPLKKEYWENEFYKLKMINETQMKAYRKEKEKFDMNCLICEAEFKTTQEFYVHVNSLGHKTKQKMFLEPYFSS